MKKRLILSLVVGFVLVSMLALTGCSKKNNDPDPLDVTGTWAITPLGDYTVIASLTHSGTAITGTATTTPVYADSISGFTAAPVGTTKPRTITLVVGYNDGRILTLAGTVSDNNKSMDGNFTNNWDTTVATWTAVKQ